MCDARNCGDTERLGGDVPVLNDPLLQPLRVGSVTLRNRVFSSSHAPGYAVDGLANDRYRLYHE
ncbi:MAG TPA: hypothetical protein DF783_08270, partial [Acidimicrobiaceae bacterium]|nr:hypothetical protein [Acidimicrobiaceae bacterium]